MAASMLAVKADCRLLVSGHRVAVLVMTAVAPARRHGLEPGPSSWEPPSAPCVQPVNSGGYGAESPAIGAANTAAKPLDNTWHAWTTLDCRPSARTVTDGPGRLAHSYGSPRSKPRARCVPDRTANRGNSRSLPTGRTGHPSWDGPARRDQASDLLSSGSSRALAPNWGPAPPRILC